MTPEEAWIQSASTTASPTSAMAPTTVDTAPTTVDTAPTTMDLAPTTVHLAPTTPASPSATPTTCHPLPRYKGKQIDNTDLLGPVVLHDLVQISWSHLLLKGALLVVGQPSRRVSSSPSMKPQ